MKRMILFAALLSVAAGATIELDSTDSTDLRRHSTRTVAQTHADDTSGTARPEPLPALERLERKIKMQGESKDTVGAFELTTGETVHLHTARTDDGQSCLIDEGTLAGASATCVENGLFGIRKVAFFVNSNGGPERFSTLYVGGVAAPSIRSVAVVKTDGSTVREEVNANGAFLIESSGSELERGVYPTALRLFGPSGNVAEVVDFPPAG